MELQLNHNNYLTPTRDPDMRFTHHFKGFGIHKSECLIEIWFLEKYCIVLFTDTGKGTSVTNASEQIITEVYEQAELNLMYTREQCLFAETYDKVKDGIDIIIPEWKNGICVDVEWRHLGKIVKQEN